MSFDPNNETAGDSLLNHDDNVAREGEQDGHDREDTDHVNSDENERRLGKETHCCNI